VLQEAVQVAEGKIARKQRMLAKEFDLKCEKLECAVEVAELKASQEQSRCKEHGKVFSSQHNRLTQEVQTEKLNVVKEQKRSQKLEKDREVYKHKAKAALLVLSKEEIKCSELRQQCQLYGAELQQQQRENEHSLMLCDEQGAHLLQCLQEAKVDLQEYRSSMSRSS
jgi:prolyl oligopeptidase PreP (S9A serine peptidase family)